MVHSPFPCWHRPRSVPYGSVPRLLLAWVTTEAVKTKERELELGDSMSAFMAERFYNEVIDRLVPIDMRALKQSPLALDIYHMLTHRMSYLKSPTVIPWAGVGNAWV